MSSKKTILLDGVKKGQLISWFATTQAANTNTVKLYDDKTTYFENSKATVNMVPPLAQGYAVVEGDNLSIDVTTSGNYEWKLNHSMLDGNHVFKLFFPVNGSNCLQLFTTILTKIFISIIPCQSRLARNTDISRRSREL